MRYWLYSEGNIIGPYTPADLLGLPAFGQGSLVCPELSTGEAADDWKPAEQVAEISAAMSVGVGGVVDGGGIAGLYSMESGYPSGAGHYYDYKFQDGTSYSSALEAIESVLGAYKEAPASAAMKPEDEDRALLDKFDVRLSKIQEELEAARWEKNLLLEKMRLKEAEEQKTRERMAELETRLKDALDGRFPPALPAQPPAPEGGAQSGVQVPSGQDAASQVPPQAPAPAAQAHPAEEGAGAPAAAAHPRHEEILEETRKVEEFSKKQLSPAAPEEGEDEPLPEAKPSRPLKSFKSIKPSQTLKRERMQDEEEEEESEPPVGKRSLKSLGYAKPKRILGDEPESEEDYGEEAPAPKPRRAEPEEPGEVPGAPIPGSALVYDFTVVTPRHEPVKEKVNFKIQPLHEPPPLPGPEAAPVRAAAAAPAPAQQPFRPVETFQKESVLPSFTPPRTAASAAPPASPVPAAAPIVFSPGSPAEALKPGPAGAAPEKASPEKTLRLPAADIKTAEAEPAPKAAPRKGRGRSAFLVVMIIFAAIAAGGMSFFFLGDGISLSDFSMIGAPAKKAPVEEEPAPAGGATAGAQPADAQPPEAETGAAQPAAGGTGSVQPAAAPEPPHQPASSENTRKAVETVKNHRLPGGRGSISAWFSNSFLSTSAGGISEEWSATALHGDIFVVQYRLLRPKQDPLVYQFEVDVAKGMIVRGINNSAIELMDFPSGDKVTAVARPAPKAAAGPAAKKAARPVSRPRAAGPGGQIPILPLPDDEAPAGAGDAAPTGFENVDVNDEKVRYIVAQESDEELF